MSDNFSILLVLKDRPKYTSRFMEYLNLLNFPYKVLVADGGKDIEIQKTLQEKQNFPNLNYEYLRFPYDDTLNHFHEKMAKAVQKIDTPTVAVMDNDDFIFSEGIEKCLDVLKNNHSYSSARGGIYRIGVSHDTRGRLSVGSNMYAAYPDSIISDTAKNRMIEQTKRFHGNWHNITRTNHVKACWGMLNIIKPQNMRFTEQITGFLNVLWGNGYRSDFPWILHQQGQRIMTGGVSLATHFPDQRTWINSDFWLSEFNKMTEVVGVSIAEYDNVSVENAMAAFAETYPLKLPDLKDLLKKRIKEAVKLGYNFDRINKLCEEVKKCNVKEIAPIKDFNTRYLTVEQELKILTNFLLN